MQVVAHNMLAQFTSRQLNITSKDKEKKSEKLSSGYRINRSADDAAGLSISEKMRWQIRGLGKAVDNCEAGASFCQIADGAMAEIEDIMQRMRELSVQAANDTNTSEDRQAIQDEIDELVTEVGRITNDTEFNTMDVFGWERTRAQFVQDPATGSWTSIGTTETIVVTGNNYGLAEVLGKKNVYSGNKLNSPIQFDKTSGWVSTGENMYGYQISDNDVINDLKKYSSAVGIGDLSSATGSGNKIIHEMTGGYRITIAYNNSTDEMIKGGYPASSILVEKGTYTDPSDTNSFVKEKVEKRYYFGEGNVGSTGYVNGSNYGSAWLDFSGLNKKYTVDSLFGQGFNTKCATCGRHYSINFTDQTYDSTLTNGLTYKYAGNSSSPRLDIGIKGCTDGEQLVAAIIEAVSICDNFNNHYTQYAYDSTNKAKLYIYDNRPWESNGGDSRFELAIRNDKNQLQIKDTVYTDMDNPPKRWVYSTKNMWIQSGTTDMNGFFISKPRINPFLLGIDGISVRDHETASNAITTCDYAIDMLNEERTKMGVQQNRLEKAAIVDANTEENTQDAESRLRDADMADEMIEYSKNSILEQAVQAMLSQANQSMQGILSVLGQ